jgi:hypothetical protein
LKIIQFFLRKCPTRVGGKHLIGENNQVGIDKDIAILLPA